MTELDALDADAGDREVGDANDGTGSEVTPEAEAADLDSGAVVDAIEERAASVRDRQVERALARCRANGDLTEAQAAAIETMAENLVDALVAPPRETVAAADDPAKLSTALDLFDPET